MMKETALGEARRRANVINRRRRVTLGADDLKGGVEEFGL